MFPYMRSQNWLYHYRFPEGVKTSLGGLARRATYLGEVDTAFSLFEEHYKTIRAGYKEFFPDLKSMAHDTYLQLTGRENA
jgi:acyl carrier protein phosphodiesterase